MPDALVSVDEVARFSGETIAANDPATLQAIAQASDIVRSHLGYAVTTSSYVELCDPINGSFIELTHSPVSAVTSVEIFNRTLNAWITLTSAQYAVSRRTGIVQAVWSQGVYFPSWPESWRVTYTAGYAVVPDAIKAAVCGIAARTLFMPSNIKSERLGGYSVTYGETPGGLTAVEMMGLRAYQRGVIA